MPQVLTIGADLLARRKFALDYYPCPVQRDPEGVPAVTGENGSVGPLGAPTSDENTVGDLLVTTFEHGKIEYDTKTDQVEVTVNGKVVPSGL